MTYYLIILVISVRHMRQHSKTLTSYKSLNDKAIEKTKRYDTTNIFYKTCLQREVFFETFKKLQSSNKHVGTTPLNAGDILILDFCA